MTKAAVVGPWAKEKLDALGRYLDFYTKVLKNQTWCRTIYVDAFAGGGRAVVRAEIKSDEQGPSLFLDENQIDAEQHQLVDGSPRVALDVANPFSRYIFIDPDPARGDELEGLCREYKGRYIDVLRTTAAKGIDWVVSRRISTRTHRGVAFLDPFGAQLEWASIQKLAHTGLFEVVINFGLNMTIQRMLPNSGEVPEIWAKRLDAYFGSHAWFNEVYRERRSGFFENIGLEKRPDYLERLLKLYRAQLRTAFGHVSVPRLIRNTRGIPLYYLLWAGPHPKGLEGANHILRMGEGLTRHRKH